MSFALNNFDLATLDWLLQNGGVNHIATGINDFPIARGGATGVIAATDLRFVRIGTPPFPTSQLGCGHRRNAWSKEALQALRGVRQ